MGLQERVRLTGSMPDPARLYGAFDLVAQASRSEGLPNALLEASMAGLPIVATDVGGTAEVVLDGVTGLLVGSDDVDALGRGLRRLASDVGLRARLGAAAHEHATNRFGMDRFVAQFADLYRTLVAARRRGRAPSGQGREAT
jgi:glycosyltransferase involved in cell wall biosynthesis